MEPAPETDPWTVYVLANERGETYVGITKGTCPQARLDAHNGGRGAKYTRGRGPWRVAATERAEGHGEALRRELEIKRNRRLRLRMASGKEVSE